MPLRFRHVCRDDAPLARRRQHHAVTYLGHDLINFDDMRGSVRVAVKAREINERSLMLTAGEFHVSFPQFPGAVPVCE